MTSGIVEILRETPGVQNLAGINEAGGKYKVYPMIAPQPEHGPYIIVSKVSNDLQSQGKDFPSTLDYPTYNVLCYHKNFRPTEIMHEAVRTALDCMNYTTDTCVFRKIWLVTDYDRWDNVLEMHCHVAVYAAEQAR